MSNSCDCPNPPGGKVTCGPDQLAICRVKGGITESECVDRPPHVVGATVDLRQRLLYNWALSVITGIERGGHASISASDNAMLTQGRYENPTTGEIVTFSLPTSVSAGGGATTSA
jgi:hypothetical protein